MKAGLKLIALITFPAILAVYLMVKFNLLPNPEYQPKYKVGDCISIGTFSDPAVAKSGAHVFNSGTNMLMGRVEAIITWGNTKFYELKIKDLWADDWMHTYRKQRQYLPVKDLDQFRAASQYSIYDWDNKRKNLEKCNKLR